MAQLWEAPALTSVKVTPDCCSTCTGTVLAAAEPSPSVAVALRPQHHACPALVRAQLWLSPASTKENAVVGMTVSSTPGGGAAAGEVGPLSAHADSRAAPSSGSAAARGKLRIMGLAPAAEWGD